MTTVCNHCENKTLLPPTAKQQK